ncbi:hypothetical protein SFRURICE_019806 [Spodoptera frugiperda]|nr:hypothetical protein SFRURICE_019806 [Spodoptera frugiperda]
MLQKPGTCVLPSHIMSSLSEVANVTDNSSAPVDPTLIFGPQRDPLFIVLPITIIYSLIFVTGLLGNIFTCIVIVRNKSMQHSTTLLNLFMSRAISDLLLLIKWKCSRDVISNMVEWPHGVLDSFGLAAEASTNASDLTITFVYCGEVSRICIHLCAHNVEVVASYKTWMLSVGGGGDAGLTCGVLAFGIRGHRGVAMCCNKTTSGADYGAYFTNRAETERTSISKRQCTERLRINNEITHKIVGNTASPQGSSCEDVVAVVVAFFICWAPFHAQRLVAIYGTTENHLARSPILLSVYSFLTYSSGVFYYMSTCINPIFYHIMSNKFRDAFKNSVMLWCCRSSERAAAKRCSYTAIAFQRNPTSSGTVHSGNSLKNSLRQEPSIRNKLRQDSRDRFLPTVHVCHNGRTIVTPPLHDYRTCKNHSYQQALKDEIINNRNSYLDTALRLADERRRPCSPVCFTYPSSPVETITVTPDGIVPIESADYSADEPEKYLKEIKLRIIQREKEYG